MQEKYRGEELFWIKPVSYGIRAYERTILMGFPK
jgi:hypothetical protein